MKEIWEQFKKQFWVLMFMLVLGFGFGKMYASVTILSDCKVLGMTRFGDVPMGCRVGETYK